MFPPKLVCKNHLPLFPNLLAAKSVLGRSRSFNPGVGGLGAAMSRRRAAYVGHLTLPGPSDFARCILTCLLLSMSFGLLWFEIV